MNLTGNGHHRNTGSGADIDPKAFENEARTRSLVQDRINALVSSSDPISLNDIFKASTLQHIHATLFEDVYSEAGKFREGSIHVGFHVPAARDQESISAWLADYERDCIKRLTMVLNGTAETLLLGFAFWKLTYIAPFADGNGRVALAQNMLIQRALGMEPKPIYNRDLEGDYHKLKHALRDWDGGNATPFLERLESKLV